MTSNRLTVILSTDEFEALTKYCKDHGFKKTGLVATMIRERLKKEGYLSKTSARKKVA